MPAHLQGIQVHFPTPMFFIRVLQLDTRTDVTAVFVNNQTTELGPEPDLLLL